MGKSILAMMSAAAMVLFCSGCDNGEEFQTPPSVEGIVLSRDEIVLEKGQKAVLEYVIQPDGAVPEGEVVWSSDNETCCTVSGGEVLAVSNGTASIVVSLDGFSDTCAVTVTPVVVESVMLSDSVITLMPGDTHQLEAVVAPEDAEYVPEWTTADNTVAGISDAGLVTAIAVGETVVTFTAGDKSASCRVTVEPVEVEEVVLSETKMTLRIGESVELTVEVLPEDAENRTVSWSSSDAGVAAVDNGVVTAVGAGQAVVSASAGGVTAECHVTVNPVEAESITLSVNERNLYVGETYVLKAVILPENTTDKTVVWSVDDPSVVSVDNGVITALAEGDATVTASVGTLSADCHVTVEAKGEIKSDWTVGELFDVSGYGRGIVFEASTDHIKVVSIDQAFLSWAVNPLYTSGYTDYEAVDCTEGNAALAAAEAAHPGNFPAYEWCAEKGSGWGLPTRKECEVLYRDVRSVVESVVIDSGGSAFPDECWTCIEDSVFGPSYAYTWGLYDVKLKTEETGVLAVLLVQLQ